MLMVVDFFFLNILTYPISVFSPPKLAFKCMGFKKLKVPRNF